LPARLNNYDTSWLDTAMQESDLLWGGCGRKKVYFCFDEDLDLLHPNALASEQGNAEHPDLKEDIFAKTYFHETGTRHDVKTLAKQSGLPIAQVVEKLWQGVWAGYLSNDTSVALRNGIESKFTLPEGPPDRDRSVLEKKLAVGTTSRRHLRRRFKRKKAFHGQVGNWYRLRLDASGETDLMEAAELEKERVRLLLDRYGILFREILFQERPSFKWQKVFRALRLMELSGEIVSGYFFKEIPGPQFMSHSGFQMLQRYNPESAVFWINAQDPASMCGLPLPVLKQDLPSRLPGSHLVYAGSRLVLTSMGHGRELVFHVDKDDTDIQAYLGVLRHLMVRQFRPLKQITVQTINGRDAARSPYVDALRIAFDLMIDYKQVILYPRLHKQHGKE
jgi:ATP-dependent Lhr-like helicase